MIIYFCLVGYILLLPLLANIINPNDANKQRKIAFFGMFGVFLVLALKAPSVGIDISGYRDEYYFAKSVPWGDFDYVYFENGYIFLEKLFSKAGVGFQLFTAIIYGINSYSWYRLIAKYSTDSFMSVLFVVCYQFFVFSVSGLRQAIAMSICIFAFMHYMRFDIKGFILGTAFTVAATFFHRSAYVFVFVIVAVFLSRKFKKIGITNIVSLLIGTLLFRETIWRFVNAHLKEVDVDTGVSLGGAFFFQLLIFIFVFFSFLYYYRIKDPTVDYSCSLMQSIQIEYEDTLTVRLALYSISAYILLSGGVLLRGAMYIIMFVVVFFTRMISKFSRENRKIIKFVLSLVLIYIFYSQTLVKNQLQICPYKFFWQ